MMHRTPDIRASRPASPSIFGTSRVSKALIEAAWRKPAKIRNVCVLAHVDHGKTTLTDVLIASNGIISSKQAGNLRFLDSREDEQTRGITMESSAITLLFDQQQQVSSSPSPSPSPSSTERFVINLIDSPGHVDFSKQATSATHLCDGCLLLVDVVEGVCAQTWSVLRQACREQLQPCLILNKIDRLICELKLSTIDATLWLQRLLSQVNAAHASLMRDDGNEFGDSFWDGQTIEFKASYNGEEEYFSPQKGNVIFASGLDGWAFTIENFATIYSSKLNLPHDTLLQGLWGDKYFDPKSKQILAMEPSRHDRNSKNLFAQFVLDPLWTIYESTLISWDEAKLQRIAEKLEIQQTKRDVKVEDKRGTLKFLLGKWLPLAKCVFEVIIQHVPSPLEASPSRLALTINKAKASEGAEIEQIGTRDYWMKNDEVQCMGEPILIYISKFFSLPLPKWQVGNSNEKVDISADSTAEDNAWKYCGRLIGMARVLHGTLKKGQSIFILYKDDESSEEVMALPFQAEELYLLMGKDLEPIESISMGNIFGLGGLENVAMGKKHLTLCSAPSGPIVTPIESGEVPIVQVALRPKQLMNFNIMVAALKAFCQTDPCAEAFLDEESGEYILATAGELHLEQCLKDLQERFLPQGVELAISEPLVPFRETINQEMQPNRNDKAWKDILSINCSLDPSTGAVSLVIGSFCQFSIRAYCMPLLLMEFINKQERGTKINSWLTNMQSHPEVAKDIEILSNILSESLTDCTVDDLWMIGPDTEGSNVLFRKNFDAFKLVGKNAALALESLIATAFELATSRGPLALEPLQKVVFFVEDFQILSATTTTTTTTTVAGSNDQDADMLQRNAGQYISLLKSAFHACFLFWSPRLMLATYTSNISTTADMLGKVYAVIARRNGKVISEHCDENLGMINVCARIPVIESFGLAEEIRGKTSGVASMQLSFYGYEVLDDDPFWVPKTEDEVEEFGTNKRVTSRAWSYLLNLRRRKGLLLDQKVVEFAEKQRTLRK